MEAVKPLPWYREPWPWILAAGPLLVVLGAVVSAWLAFATADGLVQDDYYKQGKAINRQLARDALARALGLDAKLEIANGRAALALESRVGASLPEDVRLLVSHPTKARNDRTVLLRASAPGRYVASFDMLEQARYYLTLEDAAQTWRLKGALRVPQDTAVALHAE
jgi:uncharacterized protein